MMDFEIIGKISQIETFAVNTSICELERLQQQYGQGRWRKRKGIATVQLLDGTIHTAEAH